jgi:hypothetical protein
MFGRESPEEFPCVEDFGRRADSLSLEAAIKDVPRSFDNNRRPLATSLSAQVSPGRVREITSMSSGLTG